MQRLIRRIGAIAVLAVSTVAFGQDNNAEEVGKVLEEETRVYAGSCFYPAPKKAPAPPAKPPVPSGPTVQGFGAILLPGLVGALAETSLDFAVGALKAAGSEKSASAVIAFPTNSWMYQLNKTGQLVVNPRVECIQILSGSFWNGFRMFHTDAGKPDAVVATTDEQLKSALRRVRSSTDPTGASVDIARWYAGTNYFEALKKRYRQLRWVRFFMEVRVEQMEGTKDTFYLAPNGMYFEKPVQSSWYEWSGRGTRNLLVTMTLTEPGNAEGKAFASIAMPFRNVEPETWLSPLYFEGMTSRALVAPALPATERAAVDERQALYKKAEAEFALVSGPAKPAAATPANSVRNQSYLDALKAYCKAVESYNVKAKSANREPFTPAECPAELMDEKSKLDEARKTFDDSNARRAADQNFGKWTSGREGVTCDAIKSGCTMAESDHVPIIVSATVVEIKEPSKFLAFLGDALEKAKPSVKAAVDASLPAAKATADEARRVAKEDYELAKVDVAIAEQALSSAKDEEKLAKSKDLLQKKIEANRKARAAGLPEPYPNP